MKNFMRVASSVAGLVFSLVWINACAQKPEAAGASGASPVASHAAPQTGSGAPVTASLPPSAGTFTVANIVTNRQALAGKTVTVSGKVVKYNGAILDLNWLHIQDGSGSDKDATNDITVTTTSTATVGDLVTITGTVVIDKDFGAGYAYTVLLQNASIAVK